MCLLKIIYGYAGIYKNFEKKIHKDIIIAILWNRCNLSIEQTIKKSLADTEENIGNAISIYYFFYNKNAVFYFIIISFIIALFYNNKVYN